MERYRSDGKGASIPFLELHFDDASSTSLAPHIQRMIQFGFHLQFTSLTAWRYLCFRNLDFRDVNRTNGVTRIGIGKE